MNTYLRIDQIDPSGTVELGKLSDGQLVVGRDPSNGLAIPNTAISREHGIFLKAGKVFIYRDLGSTNGSWLNGRPVKEGEWKIIRNGDVVQLADTALKLAEVRQGGAAGATSMGGRSLIVFSRGEFRQEFQVPEYGRALVIGGAKSDLTIEGDLEELPSLVVERQGQKIVGYCIARGITAFHNGRQISDAVGLSDGDEVKVGPYTVVFNDPLQAQDSFTSTGAIAGRSGRLSNIQDWGAAAGVPDDQGLTGVEDLRIRKAPSRLPFGQQNDVDVEETIAMDPKRMPGRGQSYDRHPSMRYDGEPSGGGGGGAPLESVEDKIIIFIGLLLLLVLLLMVLWWVMI